MKKLRFLSAGGIGIIVLLIAVFGIVSANGATTIDFEGLGEGEIVSSISDAGGTIGVMGFNPGFGAGLNAAIIFDGTCGGGCTGEDFDLEFPDNGNLLIIAENLVDVSPADGFVDDPDDANLPGAYFSFDFSDFGSGLVTVESLDIADVEFEQGEDGAEVQLYDSDMVSLGTVPLLNTGNHNIITLEIGVSGVETMVVQLNGSGAIDNIQITDDGLPPLARITGGGWRVTAFGGEDIRISQGLTLHCDVTLSNNLQINWNGGQKWHINKVVDAAFCFDDLAFTPDPPDAPADTYIGVDLGMLNNSDEAVACFIFTDHGEGGNDPDGPDQALIRIYNPGMAPPAFDLEGDDPCQVLSDPPGGNPNTALYVPLTDIAGGNLQFHFDQPHKNGKK